MVGGPAFVEENYDGQAYGKLRSRNLVYSAVEMARDCDMNGLRILLTNHWHDISEHYMDVISSFPETCSPHDFKFVYYVYSLIHSSKLFSSMYNLFDCQIF